MLALICFVSLTGRNVLLESHANSLVIMLLGVSLLLPLGRSLSIDSLRASFAANDEHNAASLNERDHSAPEHNVSLAALVLTIVVGAVLLFAAMLQNGPAWESGDALHYALHSDRYIGAAGEWARTNLSAGILNGWTKAFRLAEFAVLPLLLVPVARRYTRALAALLLLFVGGTIAVFFTYGALGWALLACIPLVIPAEAYAARKSAPRPRTVYYDDDCGMCLFCARLLKRWDTRANFTFEENSNVTDGTEGLPKGLTAEVVERTIVVVDGNGVVSTRATAMSEILRSLPLPFPPFGWLVIIPGIKQVMDVLYDAIAKRRLAISVACGWGACGIPRHVDETTSQPDEAVGTPASRAFGVLRTLTTSAAAAFLLLAFVAQSDAKQPLKLGSGLSEVEPLIHAATITRMMGAWDLWAPEPARENIVLVTDAETRDGWKLDVLTGYDPDLELTSPKRARKGVLWGRFTETIVNDNYKPFQKELRRYLTRGGDAIRERSAGTNIKYLIAYRLHKPIAAPGQPPSEAPIRREELLAHRRNSKKTHRPVLPKKSPPIFKPKQ